MTVEEWQSINRFFSKNLSKQLIFNNIYLYVYDTQPQYLLDDIKSFVSRYEEVEKIYKETFTPHQFWYDIHNFLQQEEPPCGWFHNGKPVPDRVERDVDFSDIVTRRIYSLKNASQAKIFAHNSSLFFKYGLTLPDINPDSEELINVCKKLFALLKPDERLDFIENWIDRSATPREEYIKEWNIEFYTEQVIDPNLTIMDSYPDMADY